MNTKKNKLGRQAMAKKTTSTKKKMTTKNVWTAILPDIKAKMDEIILRMGYKASEYTSYEETMSDEYEWIGMDPGKGHLFDIHIKLLEAEINEGKGYKGYDIEIKGEDEQHEKTAFTWAPLGYIKWTSSIPELKKRVKSLDAKQYAQWMMESLEGKNSAPKQLSTVTRAGTAEHSFDFEILTEWTGKQVWLKKINANTKAEAIEKVKRYLKGESGKVKLTGMDGKKVTAKWIAITGKNSASKRSAPKQLSASMQKSTIFKGGEIAKKQATEMVTHINMKGKHARVEEVGPVYNRYGRTETWYHVIWYDQKK
jgi:hypothetical protein